MATFTTKLSLRKPSTSDTVSVVTDLNNNFDQIDTAMGATICTSSTRPSGGTLYTGLMIYETDTKRVFVYDGSGWQNVANDFATATTGIVVAAGSNTVAYQEGVKRLGSRFFMWTVEITIASAITATAGNVTDTQIATIQAGWRPPFVCAVLFDGNMVASGFCDAAGALTIRAASDTIAAGVTVRATLCFIYNT